MTLIPRWAWYLAIWCVAVISIIVSVHIKFNLHVVPITAVTAILVLCWGCEKAATRIDQ